MTLSNSSSGRSDSIRTIPVALLGYGNVGQALHKLIERKNDRIAHDEGFIFQIVGIGTGRRGFAINPAGLVAETAIQAAQSGNVSGLHMGDPITDPFAFIRDVPAEIIAETTPLNPRDGQPALDYLKAALHQRKHVITANKGPIAFGYHDLRALADDERLGFLFEASTLGGAPVHDLARECLLVADLQRVRGVFNSTTNSILDRMRQGVSFESAVLEMQERGLAETDPSHDVDGWDSAVKLVILANVLLGADLRPADVDRTGIRGVTHAELNEAAQNGKTIRLHCEAVREGDTVRASVRPVALPNDDPIANNFGPTNTILFETDVLHLQVTEHHGTPTSTAYGMLRDLINIGRRRY